MFSSFHRIHDMDIWIYVYPYLTKIQRDAFVSRSPLQGAKFCCLSIKMVDIYLRKCYNYFDNEQSILRKKAVVGIVKECYGNTIVSQ